MSNLYAIYFSATDTTRRCINALCQGLGTTPSVAINLADGLNVELPDFSSDDIVIVAAPVYGGRLPERVAEVFSRLQGNNAIAIALTVYGNRDYDDALLEISDILKDKGFRIVGAGAFIGQHSIFPKVGTGRPDKQDEQELVNFGIACQKAIDENSFRNLNIKGNRPYKKIAGVPVHPKGNPADCVKCGKCASSCPVNAINPDKPWETDNDKCLTCGRCIVVCPRNARRNSGIAYNIIAALFKAGFSKRKDPFWTTGD